MVVAKAGSQFNFDLSSSRLCNIHKLRPHDRGIIFEVIFKASNRLFSIQASAMNSMRPRRSLQAITYREILGSDLEETNSADSDSEISDDTDTERSLFSNTVSYPCTTPQRAIPDHHAKSKVCARI